MSEPAPLSRRRAVSSRPSRIVAPSLVLGLGIALPDDVATRALALLVGSVVLGALAYLATIRGVESLLRARGLFEGRPLRPLRRPLAALFPVLFAWALAPEVDLPAPTDAAVRVALSLMSVVLAAYATGRLLWTIENLVVQHFEDTHQTSTRSRVLRTQLRGFRNILTVVIWVVATAVVLMHFERAQEVGTTLLASAGVAGVVLGFAAQRTLATLIAGMTMTLTQPLRVGDAVKIAGEFGWVEELTLTYVVVRVWDQRHVVVPITHFFEQPFENWSRDEPSLLAPTYLDVDPTADVDELREVFDREVERCALFHGGLHKLQVWDATGPFVRLRLLLSATDAPNSVDMSCEVMEGMTRYLRTQRPEWLPRHHMTHEPEPHRAAPPRVLGEVR